MSGMRPLGSLISLKEALDICESVALPTSRKESLPVERSNGRILAQDVKAKMNVPPFPRSAMDGYAVRYEDVRSIDGKSPVALNVLEKIYAGSLPKYRINKGECSEIATGGMLPKGADSIVMVEDTRESNIDVVEILATPKKGAHVISIGDDIKKGSLIAKEGDALTPAKIGSLSAVGKKEVRVFSKPVVYVMPTGDEIIRPGKKLKKGQIYDVNTYTLTSAISSFGADVQVRKIVGDSKKQIINAITKASDADMIIFSGGSSVGEKDLIVDAVSSVGKILFHGVAIRPGKPTLLGKAGKRLILGMPGHPTSCLSNAYILLEPMIAKIGRYPVRKRRTVIARLSKDVLPSKGRTTILTMRLEGDSAIPAFKESSAITSMAFADGYAVINDDVDLLPKDSQVEVILY